LRFCSCLPQVYYPAEKLTDDPNIAQYDNTNIQAYIKANGLTPEWCAIHPGDTSGIYYQILSQGSTATAMDYSDTVKFVFTLKII
jgi:FKBP-type peptidyl-prolyl cis-trans isomerase FkpA